MTEDKIVGWHHQLNEHGFGWTPGVGDGQGGLACCSPWGHKESDTSERLNWTKLRRFSCHSQRRLHKDTPLNRDCFRATHKDGDTEPRP